MRNKVSPAGVKAYNKFEVVYKNPADVARCLLHRLRSLWICDKGQGIVFVHDIYGEALRVNIVVSYLELSTNSNRTL